MLLGVFQAGPLPHVGQLSDENLGDDREKKTYLSSGAESTMIKSIGSSTILQSGKTDLDEPGMKPVTTSQRPTTVKQ